MSVSGTVAIGTYSSETGPREGSPPASMWASRDDLPEPVGPTSASALGVDVALVALHVQAGAMSDVGGERIVLVDSEEPRDRHPFIAAHEVGHLLLSGVHRRGRTRLPADIEEELYDVFARKILRGTGAWVRDVSGVTTRAG